MIRVRKAADRGYAHHGWLETHHTFSFASYQDREHMRFRSLRVMNEDVVTFGPLDETVPLSTIEPFNCCSFHGTNPFFE